jgi:hypothetical protein
MNSRAEFIQKLRTLHIRVYYERNGRVCSAVFSGGSELEILLKLQGKGIRTQDIRGVEEANRSPTVFDPHP